MNNRFFEQAEHFFKPMADIMALQAKTFEALTEKQTGLMTEVWNDGLNCAKDMSDKRDAQAFYSAQKDYWENVNHKVSNAAQDSYSLLTEAQGQMGEIMQDSFTTANFSRMAESFNEAVESAQRTTQAAAEDISRSTTKSAQTAQAQTGKTASKAAESTGSGAQSASSSKKKS